MRTLVVMPDSLLHSGRKWTPETLHRVPAPRIPAHAVIRPVPPVDDLKMASGNLHENRPEGAENSLTGEMDARLLSCRESTMGAAKC